MDYIPRLITGRLEQMADNAPVVIITGARQVGKSTLLEHTFGNICRL